MIPYKTVLNFFLAVTLIGIIAMPVTAQSKTYFVSPSGDDANSGTTINKPLRSITGAIAQATAGDTVYLLPGTYKEIINVVDKKGMPEKAICIFGYSNKTDDYPVIDGGAVKPLLDGSNDWIYIKNSEWIEVAKIKFKDGWTNPIKVNNSSYISFDSCVFRGGKRVITVEGVSSHHILVENCYWDQGGEYLWRIEKDSVGVEAWLSMHHVNMGYFNGSLIDFSGTGGSIVIRKNKIVNAFNGIRYRGVEGCDSNVEIYDNDISNIRDNDFEPEYYTYNLFIYHNYSHNIHRTLSVDNVEGGNIYYFGNVITLDNDLWTEKICTSFGKVYGKDRLLSFPLYVFNNSFYGAAAAYKMDAGSAVNFKHYNNAYYFTLHDGFVINKWDQTDGFDYDISNKPWSENIVNNNQEIHGKICDIKFTDPGKRDLTLQPGSEGIDAGKIIKLKELDWTQSYIGKAPDVGAYENGKPVDGPAFRFMIPPQGKISYKEKPRLVKNRIYGNKVILYFSDRIDPLSVKNNFVELYKGGEKLSITSVSFSNDNYQMNVEANSIPASGELSVSFKTMPKGINGETATYWASAIKIYRK